MTSTKIVLSNWTFPSLQILIEKALQKEVLFGLNKDEGSYFMAYGLPGFELGENLLTSQQFFDALSQYANSAFATAVSLMYVSTIDTSRGRYRDALKDILSDTLFFCPTKDFSLR